MECKPTYEAVKIDEIIYEGSCEQAIDTDLVLPDYCPDIGKILKCTVEPHILSHNVFDDKLCVETCSVIRIIYSDENGKGINSFENEITLSSDFNIKDISEQDFAELSVKLDYVNYRAVSQRKIDVHGALSVSVSASREKEYNLITNVDGAGVKLKKSTISAGCIAGKAQQQFSISETLELGDAKPPMASIISSDAEIYCSECKAIANKLIVKGDAVVKILYKNDLEETKTETMEFNIPYSQFIDVTGLEDNCDTDIMLSIASIRLTPRTDIDGEYKLVGMDMLVNCGIKAYENRDICIISDAYSTEYELETESCLIKVEKLCRHISDNSIIKDSADLPSENSVTEINDVRCRVCDVQSSVKDGKLILNGNTVFSIIASNDSCEPILVEKTTPFEYNCSAGDVVADAKGKVNVIVMSAGYSFSGTDKIELRTELKIQGSVFSVYNVGSICRITPDESREKSLVEFPALTIYYADAGESLWNIARSHNSSVESIMRENDICEEVLSESKMLLISV